jgi:hypothetical protein
MDGQNWSFKKNLNNKLTFILFGTNKFFEQFVNGTPSFDSTFVYKMLKAFTLRVMTSVLFFKFQLLHRWLASQEGFSIKWQQVLELI